MGPRMAGREDAEEEPPSHGKEAEDRESQGPPFPARRRTSRGSSSRPLVPILSIPVHLP